MWPDDGTTPAAPYLLPVEVANVLNRRMVRGELNLEIGVRPLETRLSAGVELGMPYTVIVPETYVEARCASVARSSSWDSEAKRTSSMLLEANRPHARLEDGNVVTILGASPAGMSAILRAIKPV